MVEAYPGFIVAGGGADDPGANVGACWLKNRTQISGGESPQDHAGNWRAAKKYFPRSLWARRHNFVE